MPNILTNPGIGAIFFIPGVNETLRVNGYAEIRTDADLLKRFTVHGKPPLSVLIIRIDEVYLHCAKAIMRSSLWSSTDQAKERPSPTIVQIIKDPPGDDLPLEANEDMQSRYAMILY